AAPGSADEISTREVVGPRAFLGCTRVVAARRDEVLEGHAAERGTGPTGRQQLLVFARRLDEVDVSPGIDEHRGEVLETQLRRLEHRLAEKLIPPQLLEPRGSQEFEAGLSVDFGAPVYLEISRPIVEHACPFGLAPRVLPFRELDLDTDRTARAVRRPVLDVG